MADKTLIEFCAPTLAGMKTGSLFAESFESRAQLVAELRRLNALLGRKGLRAVSLRYQNGRALLYLYRPDQLRKDLRHQLAEKLLLEEGYPLGADENCIAYLARRLRERGADAFPHEVGLFLGYPPEDVEAFIRQQGKNSKLTGFWKVYGDEEAARRVFSKYEKCIRVYQRLLAEGREMEDLIVESRGGVPSYRPLEAAV